MATNVLVAWSVISLSFFSWVAMLIVRPIHIKKIKADGRLDDDEKRRKRKDVNGTYVLALIVLPVLLVLGVTIFGAYQKEDQAAFIHYEVLEGAPFEYLTELETDNEGGLINWLSPKRLTDGYLFEIDGERVVVLLSDIKQKDGTFHYEIYREKEQDYPAMLVKRQFDKLNRYFYN